MKDGAAILHILEEERDNLERTLEITLKKLKDIRKQISRIKEGEIDWDDIAVRYIQMKGQLLTTGQILDNVDAVREDLQNPVFRREHIKNLSFRLNKLVKKGVLGKISKEGVKGDFYGLSEWFANGYLIDLYVDRINNVKKSIKTKKNDFL